MARSRRGRRNTKRKLVSKPNVKKTVFNFAYFSKKYGLKRGQKAWHVAD